ncbi:hypothetical protein [Sphingomonas lacunae]|nr:hypothetical protein [Sphingomonas lacunae]
MTDALILLCLIVAMVLGLSAVAAFVLACGAVGRLLGQRGD